MELTPAPSWEEPGRRSSGSDGGGREEGAGLLQPLTPRRARLEGLGEEQQQLVGGGVQPGCAHRLMRCDDSVLGSSSTQMFCALLARHSNPKPY